MVFRRRTSASQRIVSVATIGMPRPVRAVLGTRIVSTVVVLLAPLLLITGILTIEWTNGAPHFALHRDRAKQLREEAVQAVQNYQAFPQNPPPQAPPSDPYQSYSAGFDPRAYYPQPPVQPAALDPRMLQPVPQPMTSWGGGQPAGGRPPRYAP
jgi:hypothetical protein